MVVVPDPCDFLIDVVHVVSLCIAYESYSVRSHFPSSFQTYPLRHLLHLPLHSSPRLLLYHRQFVYDAVSVAVVASIRHPSAKPNGRDREMTIEVGARFVTFVTRCFFYSGVNIDVTSCTVTLSIS